MAKAPIEDTPDADQPEVEMKDTPQGGVSVPAGESELSDEEKQDKRRSAVLDAVTSAKDQLRATGPTSEAGIAIMKLEEAETWISQVVFP
jgi:hypothetical protein